MTTRHRARFLLVLTIGLVALAPLTGHPVMVAAANVTFTVNSTADAPDVNPGDGICADAAGQCTLRAAIQEADAQPAGSSITIDVPAGTYGLTLGTLHLSANAIAISGALSSTTIISGNNTSTIMAISPTVQARLSQVTITGGNAGAGNGGGIVNAGQTALTHSTLSSNTASFGGGIANVRAGRLWLINSTVSANAATGGGSGGGGGIWNRGTLHVISSTIAGNTAPNGNGGGIYSDHTGTLTIDTSTLSANSSGTTGYGSDNGGGIYNNGTLRVTNSTFNGNTDPVYYTGGGGGIYNDALGTLIVISSTLSSNSAPSGGGIANLGMLSVTATTFSGNNSSGIYNNGTATVASSILSGNGAGEGGGIYNNSGSTLTMRESTISDNSAYEGGGIINFGVMRVISSTLSSNIAQYSSASKGGGIWNGGRLRVSGSTLSSNAVASGYGGALYNIATVSVSNSTLAYNSATYGGSALWNDGGLITLSYVTVASNVDGLHNAFGTVALTGAIVANSTSGANCSGSFTDHGYNLDSGTSCGFSRRSDLSNTNPLLGPPANNGGPTQTMALLPGSPAIDEGGTSASGCPTTDQRGLPRPDEPRDKGACDIGAYESQGVG